MNEHLALALPSQSMDLVISTLFARHPMGGPPNYAVQLHRACSNLSSVAVNTYSRTNGRFNIVHLVDPLADATLALCILARLRMNKAFSLVTWSNQFDASDRMPDDQDKSGLYVPNTRPVFNPDVPKAFSLFLRLNSIVGNLSLVIFAATSREHYDKYRSADYELDLFLAYAYIRYVAQFHNLTVEQLYWRACGLLQKQMELKFRMEDLFTDPSDSQVDSAP